MMRHTIFPMMIDWMEVNRKIIDHFMEALGDTRTVLVEQTIQYTLSPMIIGFRISPAKGENEIFDLAILKRDGKKLCSLHYAGFANVIGTRIDHHLYVDLSTFEMCSNEI